MNTEKDWRTIKYGDSIVISKLVGEYNLFSTSIFPYTHCKARVWCEKDASYLALSNIRINDRENHTIDGTSGYGKTEIEALDNLIENLLLLILDYEKKWNRKLENDDYEYSDPDDF